MTGLVDNQSFSKGLPDVFTHPCCGQMRDNSMQKAQEKKSSARCENRGKACHYLFWTEIVCMK